MPPRPQLDGRFRGWIQAALFAMVLLLNMWLQSRVSTLEAQLQANTASSVLPPVAPAAPAVAAAGTPAEQPLWGLNNVEEDEFNARMPQRAVSNKGGVMQFQKLSLSERLRYLELKTNAFMNWGNHPDMEAYTEQGLCKQESILIEFDPSCGKEGDTTAAREEKCPGLYDHSICLDNFPKPNRPRPAGKKCLVYDFGIREQPQFGAVMADHFGCEVHAFDPSPVSTNFAKDHLIGKKPNYHFHSFGCGGKDGDTTLYKYNWGQVSSVRFAKYVDRWTCMNPELNDCGPKDPGMNHGEFALPVKTLPTIMKELGHEWIDIIKIDAEGSEYALLEQMFDTYGCPPTDQITMEWHHFSFDPRYGAGSSPSINAINTMLHKCGFRQFSHRIVGGWTSDDPTYTKVGMDDMRYNIVSFVRVNN